MLDLRDGDGTNDAYQLTLRNIPLNQNLRIYLESKGAVYPLYFADGTGTTNVFSLGSETPFDFGFLTLLKGAAGNSATPERSPCAAAGGILCAAAIARIPAARGADIQTFAVEKVLPEILKAKAATDKISSSFNVIWTEPLVDESVESDYADALLCRAALDGILAALYAQAAYDLDSDLAAKANENQTVSAFLAANPSFGTIKAGVSANLTQAQSYARSGLLNLQDAIVSMESEADDQSDDYVSLAELLPEEIAQAKADIADALGTLNGPRPVADNKSPNNQFTLDLRPFFAGSIGSLRALLPAFIGNDVASQFPDPTMGGTFTAGPEVNLDDTAPDNNIPDILEERGETTIQFTGWPYP